MDRVGLHGAARPSGSYRYGFTNHLLPEFFRQSVGSQHIDLDSQQVLEFEPNGSDIKQRGLVGRLHQQIKVAALRLIAMQCRAKYPDIGHTMAQRNFANAVAVQGQGL